MPDAPLVAHGELAAALRALHDRGFAQLPRAGYARRFEGTLACQREVRPGFWKFSQNEQ